MHVHLSCALCGKYIAGDSASRSWLAVPWTTMYLFSTHSHGKRSMDRSFRGYAGDLHPQALIHDAAGAARGAQPDAAGGYAAGRAAGAGRAGPDRLPQAGVPVPAVRQPAHAAAGRLRGAGKGLATPARSLILCTDLELETSNVYRAHSQVYALLRWFMNSCLTRCSSGGQWHRFLRRASPLS